MGAKLLNRLNKYMNIKDEIPKLRFGIELEVELAKGEDWEELIQKHRVIRGWEIAEDGSLEHGAEYRPKKSNKLYYCKDSIDQIKEIIGIMKAHGAHARRWTGIHVHIDCKSFDNKQLLKIIKTFIKNQNVIYRKFNVWKQREEIACAKIDKKILKKLNTNIIKQIRKNKNTDEEDNYFYDRHWGLNIQSLYWHNTLEFRLFNTTTDIEKIKKYIYWCLEFCLKNSK